jgi:hypothetical protein
LFFLPSRLSTVIASAVLFLFDVFETNFLRGSSTSGFSHGLDQTRIRHWGPHVRFRREQTLVREASPFSRLTNGCTWNATSAVPACLSAHQLGRGLNAIPPYAFLARKRRPLTALR